MDIDSLNRTSPVKPLSPADVWRRAAQQAHTLWMTYRYLKAWRDYAGLNQDQVAEGAGVQQSAYAKWERGEISPQLDKMERLAAFYRIALVDLFAPPPTAETRNLWPRARAVLSSVPPAAAEHWITLGEVMRDLWSAPASTPGSPTNEARPVHASEPPAAPLEAPGGPSLHPKRRRQTLHEPDPPPFVADQ